MQRNCREPPINTGGPQSPLSPLQLHVENIGKSLKTQAVREMREFLQNELQVQNGAFWCILAQKLNQMFYPCFTKVSPNW